MNEPSPSAEEPLGRRCCRRIVFEGSVQGIGFRYTAASAARNCGVNGYVRNRSDGTVELVADGHTRQIERLLESLAKTFADDIENQTTEELYLSEPLDGFEIRH